MSDELPAVISGTRRKAQELADGTLRVMVDIDPRFKADFHRLFPHIDAPCAIAPLAMNFERIEEEQKEEKKVGPLCRLACMWCGDKEFREWLSEELKGEVSTEEEAADWIRSVCEIDSRLELDTNEVASEIFLRNFRKPFMEWMKDR